MLGSNTWTIGWVWIVEIDGRAAGFALMVARRNVLTVGAGHQINPLFVNSAHRHQAIGQALIAAVQVASATAEFVVTVAHPNNIKAQTA